MTDSNERIVWKFLLWPRYGRNGWKWLCGANVREVVAVRYGYIGGPCEHGPVSSTWIETGLAEDYE